MKPVETPTRIIRVLESDVYLLLSEDLSKTLEQKVNVKDISHQFDGKINKRCIDITYEQVN